jgi:hypothetical protein
MSDYGSDRGSYYSGQGDDQDEYGDFDYDRDTDDDKSQMSDDSDKSQSFSPASGFSDIEMDEGGDREVNLVAGIRDYERVGGGGRVKIEGLTMRQSKEDKFKSIFLKVFREISNERKPGDVLLQLAGDPDLYNRNPELLATAYYFIGRLQLDPAYSKIGKPSERNGVMKMFETFRRETNSRFSNFDIYRYVQLIQKYV